MVAKHSTCAGISARCLVRPDGSITIPREAICSALYTLAQVLRRLQQLAHDPPGRIDAAIITSAQVEIINLQALLQLSR